MTTPNADVSIWEVINIQNNLNNQPTFTSDPITAATMLAKTLLLASNPPPDGVKLITSSGRIVNIDISTSIFLVKYL